MTDQPRPFGPSFVHRHRTPLFALGWGILVSFLLLGSIWQQPGMIDYVDTNLPSDISATLASLHRFSAAWDWYANMGRPNASFLSEQTLLIPYLVLQFIAGSDPASKILLYLMVLSTYCGGLIAIRRLGGSWLGAAAGATFLIVNPWYFDEIAQGHIYLLMSAWAVPLIFVLFVQERRWNSGDSVLGFLTVAYVVAIDFRFAALLYFVAVIGTLTRARILGLREIVWRCAALAAAPLLLAFIALPYIGMLQALRAGNAPASSSLGYYSAFTSLWASFSLVRPNYNAIGQLGHLGDRLIYVWAVSYGLLFVVALRALGRVRDRGFKTMLIAVAATGIILGSGQNSPFGPMNAALHRYIPLYGDLFRDPSKFYVLQVVAYALVLGSVRLPKWRYHRLRDFADAPLVGLVRDIGAPVSIGCAAAFYLIPFLVWDFATVSAFDPAQNRAVATAVGRAEREARQTDARFTMFPPGVRVQYAGSPAFVYDPFILFPTAPDVRIPVAYDFETSSLAVRWALATIDSGRTDVGGSLLSDLGVARIAVRDLPAQYDLPIEAKMLTPLPKPPLKHQRDLVDEGGAVFRTMHVGIAIGSNGMATVDGDRGTVLAARSLGLMPENSIWCFVSQCHPAISALAISNLSAAPQGFDVDLQRFGIADYGPHWIFGTVAWAELNLNAVRTPLPPLVGFGNVSGTAQVLLPRHDFDVWVQVVNGDSPSSYSLDGVGGRLRVDVPTSLALDGFTWYRMGRAHANELHASLTISGHGSHLCVGALRFTAPDAPLPQASAYVGSLVNAQSWSLGHAYPIMPGDGSIDGLRVFFGGRKAAHLTFRTSIPDGSWSIAIRGRWDRPTTRVRIEAASTCSLTFRKVDSIRQCRIQLRNGRFSIVTANGNLFADGIAVWHPAAVARARLDGNTLPFKHNNGSFSVATGGAYRYVAVRIADPPLWASATPSLGSSYGYGLLFGRTSGHTLTARFTPDRAFPLGVAIAALTALSIGAAIWFKNRRRIGVSSVALDRANAPLHHASP